MCSKCLIKSNPNSTPFSPSVAWHEGNTIGQTQPSLSRGHDVRTLQNVHREKITLQQDQHNHGSIQEVTHSVTSRLIAFSLQSHRSRNRRCTWVIKKYIRHNLEHKQERKKEIGRVVELKPTTNLLERFN